MTGSKILAIAGGVLIAVIALRMMQREAPSTPPQPAAPVAATPSAPATGCAPSDIAVENLRGRVDGDFVYVVGRLVNNCASATGAQIKITYYNASGDILSVKDGWPASTRNIPPQSDFPFEIGNNRQPGFEKFDVRVIATRAW